MPAMSAPDTAPALVLRPREPLPPGLEATAIRPDAFATLSSAEIRALRLPLGRRGYRLADLFTVEGDPCDRVVLAGDASALAGLGSAMAAGELIVEGDAGPRVGAAMSGGALTVRGSAGSSAGQGMAGGVLHITGDVGHGVGGCPPGARRGMAGGRLIIGGQAGARVGERMRRGVIVCHGPMGPEAGSYMRGGTIIALSGLGPHIGLGMNRGTIISFGPTPLWAALRFDCLYDAVFARLYLKALGIGPPPGEAVRYERYSCDITALGKGEVLRWQPVT